MISTYSVSTLASLLTGVASRARSLQLGERGAVQYPGGHEQSVVVSAV